MDPTSVDVTQGINFRMMVKHVQVKLKIIIYIKFIHSFIHSFIRLIINLLGSINNSSDKTLDMDECQSTSLNRCQQQCFNTFGSYKCGCDKGYQLSSDGKTCTGKTKTYIHKIYSFIHSFVHSFINLLGSINNSSDKT